MRKLTPEQVLNLQDCRASALRRKEILIRALRSLLEHESLDDSERTLSLRMFRELTGSHHSTDPLGKP